MKVTDPSFDIPILFIVFTRLDTTIRVFERIKAIKPNKLYVSADGPRQGKEGEDAKVDAVRNYIIENVDWDCEVKTLFHEKNLGCKYSPQTAITWFFEQEEKGIVLEDDCLPSLSFFKYCSELLHKYEHDLRVWGISGTNLQPEIEIENSYYFSHFFMTWGWASWRNRWQTHLSMLTNFDDFLNDPMVLKKLDNKIANQQIVERAKISYQDKLDAWDYQWIFSCFANNALLATPSQNLIQNIGFGDGATHTGNSRGKQIMENDIDFPLAHPLILHANQKVDNLFFKKIFNWMTFYEKLTDSRFLKSFVSARFGKFGNLFN
ncbi:MAG: nucleotide-diphospho-sugar transferase [Bacteroidota bacterium]